MDVITLLTYGQVACIEKGFEGGKDSCYILYSNRKIMSKQSIPSLKSDVMEHFSTTTVKVKYMQSSIQDIRP